jgi:hypothetical protein
VGTDEVDGSLTGADISDGGLTAADVATANKDGTAATPSLRTLGTGAFQALAGNASAGGDLSGTYPNPLIKTDAVGSAEIINDTVGGIDVLESTLAKVPSADTVDAHDSSALAGMSHTESVSKDYASIAAHTCIDETESVSAGITDMALVQADLPSGLIIYAEDVFFNLFLGQFALWQVCNITAAAIDPGPIQHTIFLLRDL